MGNQAVMLLSGRGSACQSRRPRFYPLSGKIPGEGNGKPLQHSCLEKPMEKGAWRAAVRGITESWHN